jgi:hypothetical protein
MRKKLEPDGKYQKDMKQMKRLQPMLALTTVGFPVVCK